MAWHHLDTRDGDTMSVDNKIECVQDYNLRKCPSFFKREFFHRMFDKPGAEIK